jgi:hypothetical protein
MGEPGFPYSILEFQARFVDERACLDYFFACRWPDGFSCPRCHGTAAWPLATRRTWECTNCHHQTSLTAGTVLHKTHNPLLQWFWAAYLMSTATPGISALQLRRQLGLGRYETAWTMLHKLRRAMVSPERSLLTGEVEVDECEVGGPEAGRKGGRSNIAAAAKVAVAVVVRGERFRQGPHADHPRRLGRNLGGLCDGKRRPGRRRPHGRWMVYARLPKKGYEHRPRSQRAAKREGSPAPIMPRVQWAISNFKV